MSSDWGSLHSILKDPTRRGILFTLSEKGPLSYAELLGFLEIEHTGKLNYHLKLLGDLISKDNGGRYVLTDKGRLATEVASKFQPQPTFNNKKILREISWVLLPLSVLSMYYGFLGSQDVQLGFGFLSIVLLLSSVFVMNYSGTSDLRLPQLLGLSAVALAYGLTFGISLANNPFHSFPNLRFGPPLFNSVIFYSTFLAWGLRGKGRREWALAVLIVSVATLIPLVVFVAGVAAGPGGFSSLATDIMTCATTQISPNGATQACSGQGVVAYVSLAPVFLLLTLASAKVSFGNRA
jgi:hypothetical protein